MVNEKRILIMVLALLACLATAVWADGQDEAGASGKVELDFDTHMFNYEPWNGMIQTVVDKYMELNPDVIINVRGGDWAEARETLLTMAAAGDAVDIMNFDADWHVSLAAAGVRAELHGEQSLNYRIRAAQKQKVPFMLVLGDRELEDGKAAVRLRSGENLDPMPVDEAVAMIGGRIASRAPQ